MKSALLLILVCAVALPVMATTVYRWVDSNGVVHYSDQPHQGAKKANLETLQVIHFKTPPASESTSTERETKTQALPHYKVTILAPADGTTLRPANHEVRARVGVKPSLGPNALVQYQLDGKSLGKPTAALRALIKKVYRGTHTVMVTVLSAQGKSPGSAS